MGYLTQHDQPSESSIVAVLGVVEARQAVNGDDILRDALVERERGASYRNEMRLDGAFVAAGLVDRRDNERDRREVVISLTPAGDDVVREVTSRRKHAIEEIAERMPVGRRQALVDALTAFAEAAEEPQVPEDSARRLGW